MLKMNPRHLDGNANRCLIRNHVHKITVGLGDKEQSLQEYINAVVMDLLVIRSSVREMYVK